MSIYVPLFYYGVTGMETTFFALQVLLLLLLPTLSEGHVKTFSSVVLTIILVLTRPEGVFLAVLVRWHQFHALLPNTYYAKATGGSSIRRAILGLRYLVRAMELTAPYQAVVLVLLVRFKQSLRRKTYLHGLALISLAHVLYIVKVGGDPDSAFPLRRHFVHISGLLALMLGSLIASRVTPMSRACRLTTALAAVAAVYISVGSCSTQFLDSFHLERQIGLFRLSPRSQLWTWFDHYAAPGTLTAVTGAGEWPYNVGGKYIDMLGLNDSHIAHMGRVDPSSPLQDSKSDMRYVLSRHPDILEGYMQASQLLRGDCPAESHGNRALMLHDLVSDPVFQNDYDFVVNGPYRIMDRAIFFRTAYARRWSISGLLTIPVSQTALVTKKCIN